MVGNVEGELLCFNVLVAHEDNGDLVLPFHAFYLEHEQSQ